MMGLNSVGHLAYMAIADFDKHSIVFPIDTAFQMVCVYGIRLQYIRSFANNFLAYRQNQSELVL